MIMLYQLLCWCDNLSLSTNKEDLIALAFDYVKDGLTDRSIHIFSRLLSDVAGLRVLDLGCGANGYYWALSYVQSAEEIIFVDRSAKYLERFQKELKQLTESRGNHFDSTITFLKNSGRIEDSASANQLFRALTEKSKFVCANFTKDKLPVENLDHVLALGSLGCVESHKELCKLIEQIYSSLKVGGKLHAIWTPYKERDEMAQFFIDEGIDGALNPKLEDFVSAFLVSQFETDKVLIEQIDYTKTATTGSYSNYSQPIFIVAQK